MDWTDSSSENVDRARAAVVLLFLLARRDRILRRGLDAEPWRRRARRWVRQLCCRHVWLVTSGLRHMVGVIALTEPDFRECAYCQKRQRRKWRLVGINSAEAESWK